MNQDLLLLIACISLLFYGCNVLADCTFDRPLSAHFGYGLICIISTWQIIPALAIGILIIFILYSGLILAIWVESKRSKNHASNIKNS